MSYLISSILTLITLILFSLTWNFSGPETILVFALVGWFFRRYDYSVPEVVIGTLLRYMVESLLLHSYQISGGQFSYLFDRPITLTILIMIIISLFGSSLIKTCLRYNKEVLTSLFFKEMYFWKSLLPFYI